MQLDDIRANVIDQDKGRWLDIRNPWTGDKIAMRFRIAGPDSAMQRAARIAMMDELAEMSQPDGTVSAGAREIARINCLARCVLDWEVADNGESLACEHKHIVRVLRSALWLEAQVDAFAGDRQNFRPRAL
jgi:hypothetical protein